MTPTDLSGEMVGRWEGPPIGAYYSRQKIGQQPHVNSFTRRALFRRYYHLTFRCPGWEMDLFWGRRTPPSGLSLRVGENGIHFWLGVSGLLVLRGSYFYRGDWSFCYKRPPGEPAWVSKFRRRLLTLAPGPTTGPERFGVDGPEVPV